jgi:YHS domain-containing protein
MKHKSELYLMGKKLLFLTMLICSQITAAWAEELKQVETKLTCMVNNTIFAKDQIPTVVNGKTYYGCCAMCAEKLANNPAVRKAIDPVSGVEVDKATAVIGANEEGKAFYFENEKNLKAFSLKKT